MCEQGKEKLCAEGNRSLYFLKRKENAPNGRKRYSRKDLYFGYKQRWTEPQTLYETVNVPEKFKPYVPDMKINVFEIAWLTDEQLSRFKSDFRIVADYFVQKRKNHGQYKATNDGIRHVHAVLQLLKVMEKDDRFELVAKNSEKEGGLHNMCDVIDHYIHVGEEKGIAIGYEKGEAEAICALVDSGMDPKEIASRLKKDIGYIMKVIQKRPLNSMN